MRTNLFPYIFLSGITIVFSGWFWFWGMQQGPISSMGEVPGVFTASNIFFSLLFFSFSWVVLRRGFNSKKTSFVVLAGLVAWYVAVVFLGSIGFFAARPLFAPNIMLAFILLFFASKKILSIPSLQEAFRRVPLHWIFMVQTFRVMGVGFLTLYFMKVLPGEFAIPTGVGDVFIGISAPLVAYLYTLHTSYTRKLAIFWNYLGIADLLMAISLGILTYSKPFQVIPTEIPNDPIALYPLIIIPVFAVPLSLLLHLFSLRVLQKEVKP